MTSLRGCARNSPFTLQPTLRQTPRRPSSFCLPHINEHGADSELCSWLSSLTNRRTQSDHPVMQTPIHHRCQHKNTHMALSRLLCCLNLKYVRTKQMFIYSLCIGEVMKIHETWKSILFEQRWKPKCLKQCCMVSNAILTWGSIIGFRINLMFCRFDMEFQHKTQTNHKTYVFL